jgi:hypothetical protein
VRDKAYRVLETVDTLIQPNDKLSFKRAYTTLKP